MSQTDTSPNVDNIALPCEIPRRIDVSKLPLQVLRSGSIEALIAQNEDFMARLTVTLRRLSLVEEDNHQLKEDNQRLNHENERLTDQCLVHQKKDEFWKEKVLQAESDAEKIQGELKLMEVRYAELYSTSEERERVERDLLNKLERTVRRLEKYRRNKREAALRLKRTYRQVRERWDDQSRLLEELKDRFQTIAQEMEGQTRQQEQLVTELSHSYESKLEHLQSQYDQLDQYHQELQARSAVFESLLQDQTTLENRAIFAERRAQTLEEQLESQTHYWEAENTRIRNDAQTSQMQSDQLQTDLNKIQDQLSVQSLENRKLREQVSSIQLLWDQSRKKIEQLAAQEGALQRLNQELSQKLNEVRQNQQAENAAREVTSIQAFKDGGMNDQRPQSTLDWIERMEESLTEIETGYQFDR